MTPDFLIIRAIICFMDRYGMSPHYYGSYSLKIKVENEPSVSFY